MESFQDQLRQASCQWWGQPETVKIVIDECNLQCGALKYLGCRLDYDQICDIIMAGHREAYGLPKIITNDTNGVERFRKAMEERGYEVQVVCSKKNNGKWVNRTDQYVLHELYTADEADVVALVSGDGDFEPALRHLKVEEGKRVEVYTLRAMAAISLWAIADDIEYLDTLGLDEPMAEVNCMVI